MGRWVPAHCRRGAGKHVCARVWLPALCLAAAAAPLFGQEPAPAAAAPAPQLEQVVEAGEYRYARSRRAGVFVSFDRGLTWQARRGGLPHRIVYPFPDPPEYAAVTSLTVDPGNPRRLAATTASGIYLTANGGVQWQRIATRQVHPHAYFTSVALSPHDPAGMLLGTSFHGVYETTDGGADWHHLTHSIRFLTDRSLFYEEVAGLSYDPAQPRAMAVLAGFDGGVFYVADRFADERDTPGTGLLRFAVPAMATIQIGFAAAGDRWELYAGTIDARWRLAADGTWSPIGTARALRRGVPLQPREPAPATAAGAPAPDGAAPAHTTDGAGPPGEAVAGPEAAAEPAPARPAAAAGESGHAAPARDTGATTATGGEAPGAGSPAATTASAGPSGATAPGVAAHAESPSAAGQASAAETGAGSPPPAGAAAHGESPSAAGQASAAETAAGSPPPPGAAAHAEPPSAAGQASAAETGAGAPPPPTAGAREPATADNGAEGAATAAGAPERPRPAGGDAVQAPEATADARRPLAAEARQAAVAAVTDRAGADRAATAAPDHHCATVPGVAAGLPQVPPPECATESHSGERAPAKPPQPGADQQPAAQRAASERPDSPAIASAAQQAAVPPTPAAAAHAVARAGTAANGSVAAAAPPSGGPAATGGASAAPPATDTGSGQLFAGRTAAPPGDDGHRHGGTSGYHPLAAGEPGWIPGPEGIGAAAPLPHAALRNGLYLRADRAAAALPEYLDLLREHGLDSIVIDFKDDFGDLGYDSELPLALAMGAAPGPIKLDRLIAEAHAAGIYVIARLVVFKDPYLYDWDDHRLAVWDAEQRAPWRHLVPAGDDSEDEVQREYWVDPFAPEVWQYNVAVAEELAARGVDEIQFDYIRFPSDGPTERATYRHRRPGMRRVDAIESFLALARERLEVPISTDLFGFNSWYRAGNFIGQDIGVLAEHVDVISPMFYPSHFPDHFLGDRSYVERAYDIYESGVRRAQRMVRGRAHIRPYVQAFLIGRELRMEEEEYSRYLLRQLDGNRAAAGSGFTLWNASNRYYMVTEPLQPYFDTRGEETP